MKTRWCSSNELTTISTLPTDTEQTGIGSGWTQKKLDESGERGPQEEMREGVTVYFRDNLLQIGMPRCVWAMTR